MSKHTPGPWRVIIDDTGGPFSGWPSVEAPDEIDAAVVLRAGFAQEFNQPFSQREALANAHLIAAAPDLLKALKGMVDYVKNGNRYREHIDAAFEAILKSEGVK